MKLILDKFLKLELEEKFFEIEIRNIKIWQFLRNSIYVEILKKNELLDSYNWELRKKNTLIEKLKKILKTIFTIIKLFLIGRLFIKLKRKDVLIITMHRKVKDGKKYICKYTNDLAKNLPKNYYVVDSVNDYIFSNDINRSSYIPISYFYFKSFASNLFGKYIKLLPKEKEIIQNLINKINKCFKINININRSYSINILMKALKQYDFHINTYRFFLKKVNPKIILYPSYTGFNKKLFCLVAKELGIPVVELQHGWITNDFVSYNFLKKYKTDIIPDYIFLFGDLWRKGVRFPFNNNKIYTVGFPYFERKINYYKKLNLFKNNKKVILFISEDTSGMRLSKLACKLNNKIDKSKYKIIYKLHQNEFKKWKENYSWLLKQKDIEVIDNNNSELYYYFSISNFQVGVYSTAVFEGINFELKTFIYKISGYEHMNFLYNNGYAKLITNVDEILVDLEYKVNINYSKLKNVMFKDNAIENMLNSIEKIIQENRKK